jgi:hypothetical protein
MRGVGQNSTTEYLAYLMVLLIMPGPGRIQFFRGSRVQQWIHNFEPTVLKAIPVDENHIHVFDSFWDPAIAGSSDPCLEPYGPFLN